MLKKALIKSLQLFSSSIPLTWLKTISRQDFLAIFYHTISDQELPHIKHLYKVRGTALFEKDLDYILTHFTPIGLNELIEAVHQHKKLPSNAFFLTFDDGLAECYHIIAPILKKKGIPATFFLNSDFVDNKALMFRYKASYLIEELSKKNVPSTELALLFKKHQIPFLDLKSSLLSIRWHKEALLDEISTVFEIDFNAFLKHQKPYLSQGQIFEMMEDGFTFGSHSQNHPTYNSIDLSSQIEQTLLSQAYLNQHFQLPYQTFAFPFTDSGVSKAFFDKILGEEKFPLTFGGAGLKHEMIKGQLQRFGMETQELSTPKQLIHTEYCYYIIKSIFRKNTIYRN
jgi:peptidoglycan/xylan/chitin deacetylase (PgdA/CDA1 family)